MKINFFTEGISFKLARPALTRKWINEVAQNDGFQIQDINYIFCSDDYLHAINMQYLKHDTLTDIITFDRSENEKEIAGDIFISIDRVQENSADLSLSFSDELNRVLIHGILHLCGYQDKTAAQQKQMREKEDACLSLLAR